MITRILIGILTCSILIHSEVFTSIGQLQQLTKSLVNVTKDLNLLIKQEDVYLSRAKELVRDYVSLAEQASLNSNNFIANPLNAVLLIKKLSHDFNHLMNLLNNNNRIERFVRVIRQEYVMANEEDYVGSIQAIHRLEDTYRLNETDMRLGKLSEMYPSRALSAYECFEFGRIAFNHNDYYHAFKWMQQALEQSKLEIQEPSIDKTYILDYLSNSTYQQGNIKHALDLTRELVELNANYPFGKEKLAYFEFKYDENLKKNGSIDQEIKNERPSNGLPNKEHYEALCREGSIPMTPKREKHLKCIYMKHDPMLVIGPIKAELINDRPHIWLFHDIVTNELINTMKSLALKRLNRARVNNPKTGVPMQANYRISKSAWLTDDEHPKLSYMTRLVTALTNLTMDTAEEWQIANYGIGGQYEPHYDFAKKNEHKSAMDMAFGNRIATLLIYLEAPERGGSTVFPNLNLAIQAKRGAAAFWYNLHTSGDGDYDTIHAACPILFGSKWVSNKWIHVVGQEFRRPCNIEREFSPEINL